MDGCVGGWMDGWMCNGLMDEWTFPWICSSIWTHWMWSCGWGHLRQKQCCGTNWRPAPARIWRAEHRIQALQGVFLVGFVLLFLFFFEGECWKSGTADEKNQSRSGTEWIGSTAGGKTIRHRCNTLVWGNVTIQWVVLWRARLPCWRAARGGNTHWHTLVLDHPL